MIPVAVIDLLRGNLFICDSFLMNKNEDLTVLLMWTVKDSSSSRTIPKFLANWTNLMHSFSKNTPRIIISDWIHGGAITSILVLVGFNFRKNSSIHIDMWFRQLTMSSPSALRWRHTRNCLIN